MKIIAALAYDTEITPLGTAPRLAEPVLDRRGSAPENTVAGMTVARLRRCRRLAGICVLVPSAQQEQAAAVLGPVSQDHPGLTPVLIRRHDAGPPPYSRLVRTARKWALDSWRGGIGGATAMDEYMHTPLLAALANQEGADAVLCLPAAAPLVDPHLADAMIEHFATVSDETRMTFTVAPPGLAGVIFRTELLDELAKNNVPPGWTMSYKPDNPEIDLVLKKCCYQSTQDLRHSLGRLIPDTDRSLARVRRCAARFADRLLSEELVRAREVGRWLMEDEDTFIGPLPGEVELELTTDDQLLDTRLRPRSANGRHGGAAGGRGPLDLEVVRKVAAELAAGDDALVVLGGFGEPLLHPQFERVLAILREAGIYGLALRTNGIALTESAVEAVLDHGVDVVQVSIDAAEPETYARLHGNGNGDRSELEAAFRAVTENTLALAKARLQRQQVAPLVVPELTKCVENVEELDRFFESWIRQAGWAVLSGYNHYGGRLPDLSVVDMAPPLRAACRRLWSRCMIDAGGRVLLCDQDYESIRPAGDLRQAGLGEIWHSRAFSEARRLHSAGCYGQVELCGNCSEWHRP